MRCYICDKELTDKEVVWNTDLEAFEPCVICLDIALDAAYSDGFSPDNEPLDDPEMQDKYGNGAVETLDPAFQNEGYGDASDIHYFGGFEEDEYV